MSAFVRWLVSEGYVTDGDRETIMSELSANEVDVLFNKFNKRSV